MVILQKALWNNSSMLHKKLLKQMNLIKEDQLAQKLKQWLEIYYFLSIIDFVYLPW